MLKKEGITAKDLLKIADAKTLLEALSLCTITS
jgi:hypothetical protein